MSVQVETPVDEPTRYCEWFVENGTLSTTCGVQKRYSAETDDEYTVCPRCKGKIAFGESEDADEDFDWDEG